MKILGRVILAIVALLIVALIVLRITGLDPQQRRAGLWLSGPTQSFPADWSFADKFQTVMVETHPWYGIPHSVTIFFVTNQGNLYLHADYDPGGKWPNDKTYTANMGRNPNIRIKLGDQVFAGKIDLVTDQALYDTLFENFRRKYPRSPYGDYKRKPDVYFLHFVPR